MPLMGQSYIKGGFCVAMDYSFTGYQDKSSNPSQLTIPLE